MPAHKPGSRRDSFRPSGDHEDPSAAVLVALEGVRKEYAAELRYRRVVAWVACALVGLLLLVLAAGVYVHRDRVADLERDAAAARAVADERGRTIQELRAQLETARGAADSTGGQATGHPEPRYDLP